MKEDGMVDLEQFREAVECWGSHRRSGRGDPRVAAEAGRLLSIIDNVGKAECAEPAAWRVLKIGASGSAFDSQDIRRAYTYEHQPSNDGAWKLGRATSVAATDSADDYIDRGMSLLNRLQEEGFGVFQIGPVERMTHQPAPVVDDAMVDAAMEASAGGYLVRDCWFSGEKWSRELMRAALTAALSSVQGVESP